MKNTTINLIGLAVLVVFSTFPRHAMAVDQWNFLQLTCIPEFSYFSLRTVHVEHNYDGTPPYQKLATQKGLYSPEALSKKSYECKSAKRTISVELVDYIPPHETGMCAASPSFSVLIRNDGQEVNKFDADLCHGNAQFVEIFNSHHVHCVMPASPSKGDNVMSCERFEIGLNARNPEDGRTFA